MKLSTCVAQHSHVTAPGAFGLQSYLKTGPANIQQAERFYEFEFTLCINTRAEVFNSAFWPGDWHHPASRFKRPKVSFCIDKLANKYSCWVAVKVRGGNRDVRMPMTVVWK